MARECQSSRMAEVGDGSGAKRPPTNDQPSEQIGDWIEIADGVHRLVAEPAGVTIGLVVGSRGALLIDTGSSPQQGAELRAAVARVTDRPLLAVVVSHGHYDHAFGLSAYTDLPTIGHESLADDRSRAAVAEEAVRDGIDPAAAELPRTLISIADVVDLGGSRVAEIVHLGVGHTRGDLVVSVTDAGAENFPGVIFAGDLIETAAAPWFGPESSPDQWSWTVDRLHGLGTETTVYVPGHGDPIGRDAVLEQRNAIDGVRMEIERLAGSGVAQGDALAQGDWPIPGEHVADGIAAGYVEIAARAEHEPGAGGRPTLPLA